MANIRQILGALVYGFCAPVPALLLAAVWIVPLRWQLVDTAFVCLLAAVMSALLAWLLDQAEEQESGE